jgi:signal transduction histidine kinase/CheY-like chemotaxis protein/HPt (histidine-containing phosphotransfer) domain-containing protein
MPSASQRASTMIGNPNRFTITCATIVAIIIAIGTGLFLSTLRDRILAENERELANTALILARQVESVFAAVEDTHNGTVDHIAELGTASGDLDAAMARKEVHVKLRDRATGMPFIGSLTLVNSSGKVVNFSRQWPVPTIDVTDRDFFKALSADPALRSFVSEPVRNRASGTRVVHLARRISGPGGEFRGLISGAMELTYFEDFFADIALAPGSAIELLRADSTLLLRHPKDDTALGARDAGTLARKLVASSPSGAAVGRDTPNGEERAVAAHRVDGYPVIVAVSRTTGAIYAGWTVTAQWFGAIAVLTILMIVGMVILVLRLFGKEQDLIRSRAAHEQSEQLRVHSQRFDLALSNMSQGLSMFDAQQRLIVSNARYAQIYDLPSALLRPGTTLREILQYRIARGNGPENDRDYVDKRLESVAEHAFFKAVNLLRDGRTIAVVHQPMPDGGWVATHEDITELRRSELERAQAIAQAELFHERELAAEAANKAKSDFLAVMSHEIRTPMTAVIGLSSVLLETKLDEDQHHIAETIHESSNTLHALLNDILDVSKLDAGKIEFEAAPFSLRALIDNAASIVEASARQKSIALDCKIDAAIPGALIGDQTRIRQVVLNLMANAIKFSDSGVVEIAARCLSRSVGSVTFACAIRDSGIGIAPEHLGKLFGDFSQADSSINRRFGGTGLGLAICKRIVVQMGGDIRVASAPGAGTTFEFTLTLPVASESDLASPDGATDNAGFADALATLDQPLHVLLAEDNPTNQFVFRKLMQNFRIDVTVAANGIEAVEHARRRTFDIVFMDMRMPEMDGLEATRRIRALGGAWSHVPIVALTANAFADDVKACRDAGMTEFVPKPMRKKALIEKLALLLADHPALGPLSPSMALPVTPAAEVAIADVAPVLDTVTLNCLREEIDSDGVRAAFDVFVQETCVSLAMMRKLANDDRPATLREEAHQLKGAAATFGLCQLSDLARTLEMSSASLAADERIALIDRLDAAFARSHDEAEAAIRAMAPAG